MIGLSVRLLIWVFAALVVAGATTSLIFDAIDKIESLRKHIPWIPKTLRRDAFVTLLSTCCVLLIGVGYELLDKEIPKPATINVVFNAPSSGPVVALAEVPKGKQRALESSTTKQKLITGMRTLASDVIDFHALQKQSMPIMIVSSFDRGTMDRSLAEINHHENEAVRQFLVKFSGAIGVMIGRMRPYGLDASRLEMHVTNVVNIDMMSMIATDLNALADELAAQK